MEEMLLLRKEGWSLLALGQRYCKSHATILHHCKKYGVFPVKGVCYKYVPPPKPRVPIPQKQARPGDKYLDLIDEPKNSGKSYKQYVKESLERPTEAIYERRYGKLR